MESSVFQGLYELSVLEIEPKTLCINVNISTSPRPQDFPSPDASGFTLLPVPARGSYRLLVDGDAGYKQRERLPGGYSWIA